MATLRNAVAIAVLAASFGGLAACGTSWELDLEEALSGARDDLLCRDDAHCPDGLLCVDERCRITGSGQPGDACERGADCRTGLACVVRRKGGGGTCEDVARLCSMPPDVGPCARASACARDVCRLLGTIGSLWVTCGDPERVGDPRENPRIECEAPLK